jgi:predicted nucleotidyltransferase
MSSLLYKTLQSSHLKDIVHDLQKAASELEVDFFGVGALARNVWYVSNNEPPRGTQDVDFGVYIPSEHIYAQLKNKLVKDYSYTIISTNAFCLMSPYGIPLDLLPFGDLKEDNDVIREGAGLLSMNLDGFSEVYTKGLILAEIESDNIKVCSIPSVILLKLIAYDDRPENRPNDPLDIDSILKHYPTIEMDLIWGEYTFLCEEDKEDLSPELLSIKVLGYEISKIIHENEKLTNRILSILDKAIDLDSILAQQMIQNAETETIKSKTEILKTLKEGIQEGLKKYS